MNDGLKLGVVLATAIGNNATPLYHAAAVYALEVISQQHVPAGMFRNSSYDCFEQIGVAMLADRQRIAPTMANAIGKRASGIADGWLSTVSRLREGVITLNCVLHLDG